MVPIGVGVADTGGHDDHGSGTSVTAPVRGRTGARPRPIAWREVAAGSATDAVDPPLASRRVYLQVLLLTALVVVAVAVLGAVASRQVAEQEAVNDAAQQAAMLADTVIEPALSDGVLTSDPQSLRRLDEAVHRHVLNESIVRVKVWTPEGRIVYSDEPRLVDAVFSLGEEERDVLVHPATHAEVSDLKLRENQYEAGQGKLLEVYRPVWTPSGQPLLFEIYAPYTAVTKQTVSLWRGFGGITLASLLVLVVLLLPVLWRVLDRLGRAQSQREAALAQAVEASTMERRRIAGTLHDGVVQELAATSFVVTGAALRAEQEGNLQLTESLRRASESVRTSIGGLRSLLVDIYPPSLEQTGLDGALRDLVSGPRSRDLEVELELPAEPVRLREADERLVYRIAQECLRNATRHSRARRVEVSLRVRGDEAVLEVADDGVGFDSTTTLAAPAEGHFGLRLMADTVAQGRGRLLLQTAPGAGCRWQLRVPRT